MLQRRQILQAAFAGAAVGLVTVGRAVAQGDAWPSRPVRIVAWAPGGAVDTIARRLGQKLSEARGKPVVVENKSGATGTVEVARSAPGGMPPDSFASLLAEETARWRDVANNAGIERQ